MSWYYDHEGVAEGPHDDVAMAAARKNRRIMAQTLVWHRALDAWKPAAELNPPWWEHDVVVARPTLTPMREPPPEPHRRPVPKAPITPRPPPRGGLLHRLFGRSSKKTG